MCLHLVCLHIISEIYGYKTDQATNLFFMILFLLLNPEWNTVRIRYKYSGSTSLIPYLLCIVTASRLFLSTLIYLQIFCHLNIFLIIRKIGKEQEELDVLAKHTETLTTEMKQVYNPAAEVRYPAA